jgi:hypothetical protein
MRFTVEPSPVKARLIVTSRLFANDQPSASAERCDGYVVDLVGNGIATD